MSGSEAGNAGALGGALTAPAPARRDRPWVAWCELSAVAAIFIADWMHWIPFSKTPVLLALAWVSLRARGLGWKSVGLGRPKDWRKSLALGLACGALLSAFELFVSQPLLIRITGEKPDLHDFEVLTGNLRYTLVVLGLVWTLAAFGEEMVYRGYVMNRVADLGGRTRAAWLVSLITVNLAFGLAHTYQGITGVVENAIDGAALAWMYLGSRRNLWVPVLAHGVGDTVDILLIFLGKYPTL
jgi:membrane protease YdiL (CAAX protease family)